MQSPKTSAFAATGSAQGSDVNKGLARCPVSPAPGLTPAIRRSIGDHAEKNTGAHCGATGTVEPAKAGQNVAGPLFRLLQIPPQHRLIKPLQTAAGSQQGSGDYIVVNRAMHRQSLQAHQPGHQPKRLHRTVAGESLEASLADLIIIGLIHIRCDYCHF
ncbi:hypothetical protein SDC9_203974 [bioreactor metagenome]|uniref:Uncharacterized protein n=1 Tax=bioreactor metagenome TaxID=1076179 RepID=A0A645IXZ9_9ZZZZ